MSFYDAIRVGASGAADFEIERSLRFNTGDTTNLTRTSSSASNTFTYSAWIKRCTFTGYQYIFSMGGKGFSFHTTNNTFYLYDGNNLNESSAVFRDPSAWYHVVVQINSGVATSYINNQLVHNAVGSGFALSTNTDETRIGFYAPSYFYFDGYMAEVNLVDGSVLAPSSFAETDAVTGQWVPKDTSGLTFGTNGFRLKFADNSGTTATTLGKDSSGNGNNFTPNNFSVAAGAGNDSLEDTPTNNFCTLNSISLGQGNEQRATLSNGNLDFTESSSSNRTAVSTFGLKTGKWYFEFLSTNTGTFSIGWHDMENNQGSFYRNNGSYSSSFGGGGASGYASWTTNDIVGVAIDFDSGKIWYAKNNSWQSGDPATGNSPTNTFTTGRTLFVEAFTDNSSGTKSGSFNFGQRAFSYTPPTGYKSICSANLPDPTILLPDKHFDIKLYTGSGSTQNITGINFKPDWVWMKSRSSTNGHAAVDTVRGRSKIFYPDTTQDEDTSGSSNDLVSFNSDGFTVGSPQHAGSTNNNGLSIVAWTWNAGDTDGKTYAVTVVSDSGNKYRFDGFGTSAVTIRLAKGGTYIFDQSDSSNAGHPLRFSATSNGTHGGGTEYTTGVTTAGTPGQAGAYTQIVVDASAPVLYYYCTNHSGMGGQVDTNTDLGSSNFDGTGQAVVKANTTAGFSIVSYTGNATGSATSAVWQTIGHGLGVVPQVIIMKSRSFGDADTHWATYHHKVTDANTDYLVLDTNEARVQTDVNYMGSTLPTASVFSLGYNFTTNKGSENYMAYCFSEVAGYSKFGKYVGNGSSSNAPFVFTGFRPAWVIIKQTGLMDWVIDDTTRSPFNESNATLFSNLSDAEYTGGAYGIDFYSNGFKPFTTYNQYNQSGQTYIFLAFAESPFKNSRAR